MTTTAATGRKRGYHHGNLPAALLEAAHELVEEGGTSALTLRRVAQRVGVTHAAPYRHFRDKSALLSALAQEGFSQLSARLASAQRAAAEPHSALVAMGNAYLGFARAHAARFAIMYGGNRDVGGKWNHGSLPAAGAELQAAAQTVVDEIAAGLRDAELWEGDDPQAQAMLLWAWWHGLAQLGISGWLNDRADGKADALALVTEVTGRFVAQARLSESHGEQRIA